MQKLIYILCDFLNSSRESGYCHIRFYKNLPQDTTKICQNISQVGELISHKTKLELMPFIENSSVEIERLNKEKNRE